MPGVSAAPHDWSDLRIAAGADGSGTRLVADGLLEITGARIVRMPPGILEYARPLPAEDRERVAGA
jgi:hypothetical protein